MSLIYTAINIPYCSVGGVITLNQKERMGCLSWRFSEWLATLIISSSILPLTDWLGNGDRASGFQLTMVIMGGAATLMFLFCFSSIKERVVSVKQNESLKKTCGTLSKRSVALNDLYYFPERFSGIYPRWRHYLLCDLCHEGVCRIYYLLYGAGRGL